MLALGEGTIERFVKERGIDAGFVFAGILLGVFLDWDMITIVIFVIFLWSLLGPIASRYLAWPALFFLAFTPILLLFDRDARAEEFAVYAYYFLVMAVVRGIIEVRQEESQTKVGAEQSPLP